MMNMPPERFEDSIQIMEFPFRKIKTSDFFDENIRTFAQRSPMFCTFRVAVSLYPPQKKVFENLLHFLHHNTKGLLFTDNFG